MFLKNPLLLVLSCGFLVSAIPLELTENSASKLSPIPNIVKPIFSSSASIPPLNASAENAFNIRCDGETYGFHPNIVDCEGAKEYLMPDTRTWTFGERHTGLPANVLALPYRIMGDRGLCYVQAVLIGDHTTAKATLSMLRRAAAALVLQCATSLVSQGGIATNIGRSEARPIVHGLVQGHILIFIPWLTPLGGDNNLGVILGKYQIPVSCRGALPSWDSCRDIIYDMPADKVTRVFGPGSDPAVRESLPYSIDSCEFTAPLVHMLCLLTRSGLAKRI